MSSNSVLDKVDAATELETPTPMPIETPKEPDPEAEPVPLQSPRLALLIDSVKTAEINRRKQEELERMGRVSAFD